MLNCLDLHCGCGCDSFHLQMNPKEMDMYEIICDDCQDTIATISCFSLNWVGENEDAENTD